MTNMIRRTLLAIKGGTGGAGIWIANATGRLFIDRQGGVAEPIASDAVRIPSTAAYTVKPSEDGVTLHATALTSNVFTLPAVATVGIGFLVTVVTKVLPTSGAGTTITPAAADKFQGNGFNAKTDGQTLVNSAASDAIGDLVQLQSDADGWFVIGKVGTWA